MQIYLVGGAIRDRLLGLPAPLEHDWVVVGSSPEEMRSKGFIKVGKSFPVYIDPKNSEEYALARTESKSGHGYHGFDFNAGPEITLEEDLMRRDLTINAIAEDDQGKLIDPFNGMEDLKDRVLRHVSDAFRDDPLRVLRVARFMSKLSSFGFSVAEETKELIKEIVNSGELDYLVPERIWLETEKALQTECFDLYFKTLSDFKAIDHIYPDLKGIDHVFSDSPLVVYNKATPEIKMASIFCALDDLNEKDMIDHLDEIQNRMKFPNSFSSFAKVVLRTSRIIGNSRQIFSASDVHQILEATDAFRNPENLSMAIEFHNLIDDPDLTKKTQLVKNAFESCKDIGYDKDSFKGLEGDAIKVKLDALRIEKIDSILN
ncbi:MAG: multifunctional CCA tRNA nucleotidyl transferase/2'3'-cyclic phosphodiesterase/2'nucleotidase/phosphatase [Gammaproteobacteria bacterium]|jgi:tRNA nucleotidyltransferase (CCA-adding enzyme)|nr:multifunctional CCA tRNA nucleotidyl transferase/2'3'-cyclic phosphodiesterase/2'nucleotidase/phosphatase [Gammaproteobacteria bacterium]MBQ08947.1 multifunctional CCA tRNA nucleotidyl transferase/2'3'-cyclic phosphodiesterase/2'nucleotidase/phosphatase [Gammaproteobacteria bacterium]MDP6147373.1 multifunctional CCA tRNA nucleotidyl transferase/2'3'-cyclic phosphodiesterase/2'nucleotidase/phosphatase [Gammaproteobacteria bacterium]HJL80270.1 multifunctional CCA tRNA nucleotidyl transferase/2'|tara:strand:- start:2436 stop:3557 length:1122 start_codon:yes stop_codon:yes gene_type:complete